MVLYIKSDVLAVCFKLNEQGIPLVRLEVKHYHQPRDLYCVPTSIKMSLDCVCRMHKIKGLNVFTLSKIAKITKTTDIDGTPPRAAEQMNEHLLKARPSLSFVYHEGSKFTAIDKELNEKHLPVIAYLNPVKKYNPERPFKVMHAVVVVEYDPKTHIVYYDDPEEETEATAIKSLEVGMFTRQWEWEKKWVQVLLGKDQTNIQGFLEQGGIKK
jgi:hypothetical protein